MNTLKYTTIKSRTQYNEYCEILEELTFKNSQDEATLDEIDLVTLLIENWDRENTYFRQVDPVTLLRSLMADHKLKASDLAKILGVGKSLVSEILNYRKGLSKDVIRGLAEYFKLQHEAFNRPYKLISPVNSHLRDASIMNTTKDIERV
jgi:HTH-type transcriptional regulator/antitoxin HigA